MRKTRIDISAVPSPYSFGNKVARVAWGITWLLLFRPSPKPCFMWRRFLLRIFGADLAKGACVHASCRISQPWMLVMQGPSYLGPHVICEGGGKIEIGEHSTVSQYSYLCTSSHDYEQPNMPLISAPIVIEDQVWVCASVFIGPGVVVGQGAVIGARTAVFKAVQPWTVVGGNPASLIKRRILKG